MPWGFAASWTRPFGKCFPANTLWCIEETRNCVNSAAFRTREFAGHSYYIQTFPCRPCVRKHLSHLYTWESYLRHTARKQSCPCLPCECGSQQFTVGSFSLLWTRLKSLFERSLCQLGAHPNPSRRLSTSVGPVGHNRPS